MYTISICSLSFYLSVISLNLPLNSLFRSYRVLTGTTGKATSSPSPSWR